MKNILLLLFLISFIICHKAYADSYKISIKPKNHEKTFEEICDDQVPECNIYIDLDGKTIQAHIYFKNDIHFEFEWQRHYFWTSPGKRIFYIGISDLKRAHKVSLYIPNPQSIQDRNYTYQLPVERVSQSKVTDLEIFVEKQ